MTQVKADDIATQLLKTADEVRYGTVTVSAKLHNGRIVEVAYTKTEQTRVPENQKEKDQ